MALPGLPAENDDPWFDKRNAFDQAVKQAIETDLPAASASGDNTTLDAAKTYADSGDANTLSSANSYSDTSLNNAKSYADTNDASNLSAAKTYTDGQIKANEYETVLASGTDLNTVTTPGRYFVPSVLAANPALNTPTNQAGHLEVVGYSSYQLQRYTSYNAATTLTTAVYTRSTAGGIFTAWTPNTLVANNLVDGVTSLDSITTPGNYLVGASNNTADKGAAEAGSTGYLEVFGRQGKDVYQIQRYTSYTSNLVYVRSAKSPIGSWSEWKLVNGMEGHGSPYGKIIPSRVGVTYTDLDNTNGALKWVAAGTTSVSWSVLFGDTGRRDLSQYLVNGATKVGGGEPISIQRVGSVVYCEVSVAIPTWVSGTAALEGMPLSGFGFRSQYMPAGYAGADNAIFIAAANGSLRVYRTTASTGLRYSWSWIARDPWPTSLPGMPS